MGFKREFCKADKSGMSGSGRSGTIYFEVTEAAIYEFKGFCVGSTSKNWEWSGFIHLKEDGTYEMLSKKQVIEMIKQ